MSKKMAGIFVVYGIALVLLAFAHRRIAAGAQPHIFAILIAGGVLAIICGVVAWSGHKRRVWIVVTLAILGFIFLGQTVTVWVQGSEERNTPLALLQTVIFGITAGALMYALHGERPPEFYQGGGAQQNSPSKK